jgi:hypothetical protein
MFSCMRWSGLLSSRSAKFVDEGIQYSLLTSPLYDAPNSIRIQRSERGQTFCPLQRKNVAFEPKIH